MCAGRKVAGTQPGHPVLRGRAVLCKQGADGVPTGCRNSGGSFLNGGRYSECS